jgi:hypothetical protein
MPSLVTAPPGIAPVPLEKVVDRHEHDSRVDAVEKALDQPEQENPTP